MPSSNQIDKSDISLCIINYNGLGYLPDTLQHAQEHADEFVEIIFVDNGSTDDSIKFVESRFPEVRIVRLEKNRGAAAARNAGINAATTRFLLFLDNDVLLLDGCAGRLLDAIGQQPEAVIAAPCVRYRHNPDTVQFCGADNHFTGLMILHEEDKPVAQIQPGLRDNDSVVTASFLIDRSKLSSDNRFDEIYFYQMEDHDYGVRQRLAGYRILAVPEAQVLHGEGAQGLSIRREGKYSDARVYGLIRNRWLFLLKFYRWRTIAILSPVLVLYELAQFGIVVKKGWFKHWRQSAGWIFSNWSLVMTRRRELQNARRVPDRQFIKGGRIPHRRELTASRVEVTARNALDATANTYWRAVKGLI